MTIQPSESTHFFFKFHAEESHHMSHSHTLLNLLLERSVVHSEGIRMRQKCLAIELSVRTG